MTTTLGVEIVNAAIGVDVSPNLAYALDTTLVPEVEKLAYRLLTALDLAAGVLMRFRVNPEVKFEISSSLSIVKEQHWWRKERA